MLYVGVDIHKSNLQVCLLDEQGNRCINTRVENSADAVEAFFRGISLPASVGMEPTHNWGRLYDLLSMMGLEVKVCHPRDAKLIGLAQVKTDRTDAYKLATLLRVGLLPESYVPTQDGRELRCLVRGRAALKGVSTALKNQIHAILKANWIKHPYSDLFGKAGREFLADLMIESGYRDVMETKLEVLDCIDAQVRRLDKQIALRAGEDMRVQIVMTAPGFGCYRAVLVVGEVEDISRFRRAESFVCSIGLNPREDSSGETTRRGRITKEGSSWLRWVFIEAAHQAIKQEGKIRDLYLRVLERRGHNKAIVAAARELAVSIYWMLRRMEPYSPSGRRVVSSEAR